MSSIETDKKKISVQLQQIDKLLEQCRAKYELFFSGIEKIEPQPLKNKIKKDIQSHYQNKNDYTVAERFKLEALSQRLVTLSRYWDRVMFLKEKGVYYKDVAKKRRLEELGQNFSPSLEKQSGIQAPERKLVSEARLEEIYQEFLQARSDCNQSTAKVSIEKLEEAIYKQVPSLEKKGYVDIDFKVVVKEGKAALQAFGRRKRGEENVCEDC